MFVEFADALGRGCVDELPVGEIELIAEVFGLVDGDGIHEEAHVEPSRVRHHCQVEGRSCERTEGVVAIDTGAGDV